MKKIICKECGTAFFPKKDYKCTICKTDNSPEEDNSNKNFQNGCMDNGTLIKMAKKSVVKINVEFLGMDGYAKGSGWLAYNNLIITNAHVIIPEGNDVINNIICEFDPDLKLKNSKIFLDPIPVYISVNEDIAILKPLNSNIPSEIPVFKISDVPPQLGEKVFTIGSPLNYDFTCMEGIVANLDYKNSNDKSLYNYLQTTLILNSGNSGGAVFNTKAEVIGMATFNDLHLNHRDGVVISEQGMIKGKIITNDAVNGYGFCIKREAILDALNIAIRRL